MFAIPRAELADGEAISAVARPSRYAYANVAGAADAVPSRDD